MKRRDYEQSDWNSHRIDLLLRRQFPSLNLIVAGLVLFRLLNGLSLFSFFDPDEFWQVQCMKRKGGGGCFVVIFFFFVSKNAL